MNKYFLIAKNTWDEIILYRTNFMVWRLRIILQIITVYFLWFSLIPANDSFFSYSQESMLTYILGTSIVGSLILSSRVAQVGDDINNGNLSNYLLKPIHFFSYWFSRDMADKLMNTFFSLIEIALFVMIVHPVIFLQQNIMFILLFLFALGIAIFINFFFDFLLSFIAFWTPEVWAPRFMSLQCWKFALRQYSSASS